VAGPTDRNLVTPALKATARPNCRHRKPRRQGPPRSRRTPSIGVVWDSENLSQGSPWNGRACGWSRAAFTPYSEGQRRGGRSRSGYAGAQTKRRRDKRCPRADSQAAKRAERPARFFLKQQRESCGARLARGLCAP